MIMLDVIIKLYKIYKQLCTKKTFYKLVKTNYMEFNERQYCLIHKITKDK